MASAINTINAIIILVAPPAADFAGDVHGRQEVHLDDFDARAFAFLAAAAGDVEGESARLEAADLGVRRLFEERADVVEDGGEGGGIGARRPADGTLVNLDEFIDVLHPFDGRVRQRALLGPVELVP